MAGLVAQNQTGAFSSPANGQDGDASVVLSNDNTVRLAANAHDADATIHVQSSVLASRPTAGTAQRVWITTDGLRAYIDDGANWDELAYLPLVGGTLTGGLTVSSGTTAVQALTATTGTFTGSVLAGATSSLGWTNRGLLQASSDGALAFYASNGSTAASLAIGALTATTGTFSSTVTLGNNVGYRHRNAANSADLVSLLVGTDDAVRVGFGSGSGMIVGVGNPTTITSASAGDVVLANTKTLRGANAAGTDTLPVVALNSSNRVVLGSSSAHTQVAGNIGFYGTAPQAKPTVTGSVAGNTALDSLLSALATLGLITDSSI